MQIAVLIGLTAFYAAVAAAVNWWLRKNSALFRGFLAVVISQTIVFGGDYIYSGYWDAWNDIALVTSSAMCIAIVVVVTALFRTHESTKSPNAPT